MAVTDYKPFQTVKLNSYTQLDIVPHSSIESVAFEKCADPKRHSAVTIPVRKRSQQNHD